MPPLRISTVPFRCLSPVMSVAEGVLDDLRRLAAFGGAARAVAS
ncbi:hypothetical protein [Micromonospora sp. LOL_023]